MSRYNLGNSMYEDTKETLCLDPVDGGWSEWSDFSECTTTCGTGYQTRERTCNNPKPAHGGRDCQGEKFELKECKKDSCQYNDCLCGQKKNFAQVMFFLDINRECNRECNRD